MKKNLVASAVAACIFVPSVSAIEIYNDTKNAVEIGGWVDARIINTQGATEVVNGASRINFSFSRDMGHDWKTFAKLEWGLNPFGNSDIVYSSESNFQSKSNEFLHNRLGYAGLAHDKYGSLSIGKQWGVWYDVVYSTNLVNTWDGNTSGTYTYNKIDGGVNGTGRGDNTVQYRNSFGDISFGLQVQLKQDEFDLTLDPQNAGANPFTSPTAEKSLMVGSSPAANEVQATVEYNDTIGASITYAATDMLTLTAGVNLGEFDGTLESGEGISETDYIYGAGLIWGGFEQPGLYVAININKNEFHDTDNAGRLMPDAVGLESLISYKFDNGLKPIFAYNYLKAGDEYEARYNDGEFKRQFIVAGLHFVWDEKTMLYVEARKDMSEFNAANDTPDESDGVAFGIRYYM